MKTYEIVYMDGVTQIVTGVESAETHENGTILRLYASPVYGMRKLLRSIVLANVRHWESK